MFISAALYSYVVFSSAFANGNITLDVLPVKGPQGPPLRAAEPSLKVGQFGMRPASYWQVQYLCNAVMWDCV